VLIAITVGVATWVAGFDVFYALPDEAFDRREGLKSAVVRLGERRAILLAKLLHGITVPALALFGWGAGFGPLYYAGLVVAAGLLAYEHHLVRPGDLSRLDAAFFTMNGVMSVTVFGFALVDVLW
jgi:4-hydroxybenzoate polyprenyltransferase